NDTVNFTIVDNDAAPKASVNDQTVSEGAGTATFTVSLSNPSDQPGGIDVPWATAPQTATGGAAPTPGVDYISSSGTVHFNPGETKHEIHVLVNGDTTDEPDESFEVQLSNPVNASINDNDKDATIKDDDAAPTVSIGNDSVHEGDSGTVQSTFDVVLSAASGYTVTVDYATADGTAKAGSDYVAEHGTLTFPPGQ